MLLAASSLALPRNHHTRPLIENLGDEDAVGEDAPLSLISDDPDVERKAADMGLFEQFGLAKRDSIDQDLMSPVKLKMVTRDLTCGGAFDYQKNLKSRDFEYWSVTYEPTGSRDIKNQVKVYIDQQCAGNAIELAEKYAEIETFMDTDEHDVSTCVLRWGVAKMSIPVKDDTGKKTKTETKQARPLHAPRRGRDPHLITDRRLCVSRRCTWS